MLHTAPQSPHPAPRSGRISASIIVTGTGRLFSSLVLASPRVSQIAFSLAFSVGSARDLPRHVQQRQKPSQFWPLSLSPACRNQVRDQQLSRCLSLSDAIAEPRVSRVFFFCTIPGTENRTSASAIDHHQLQHQHRQLQPKSSQIICQVPSTASTFQPVNGPGRINATTSVARLETQYHRPLEGPFLWPATCSPFPRSSQITSFQGLSYFHRLRPRPPLHIPDWAISDIHTPGGTITVTVTSFFPHTYYGGYSVMQ